MSLMVSDRAKGLPNGGTPDKVQKRTCKFPKLRDAGLQSESRHWQVQARMGCFSKTASVWYGDHATAVVSKLVMKSVSRSPWTRM
jgi:hypothetical protein